MFFMGLLTILLLLQYRKRYELLQRTLGSVNVGSQNIRYNTASGMSCCNRAMLSLSQEKLGGYNTASGMNCCNPTVA